MFYIPTYAWFGKYMSIILKFKAFLPEVFFDSVIPKYGNYSNDLRFQKEITNQQFK